MSLTSQLDRPTGTIDFNQWQIEIEKGLDDIELSIIMPCLNEAETLQTCIQKAKAFLDRSGIKGEIIIADNGSTDGSQEITLKNEARLVPVKEKGYGNALAGGIANARGKYIIMGDADDSYDFSELGQFLYKLRAGYDLVMGNRFDGKIVKGAMPALHKYLGNPVLSGIGRLFFKNPPCRDFHCGLRGFRKDAFEKLDLRTTGMEFASEMVVKATLQKLSITEVPITLYPDGRSRPPHLRSWRDGWRHLRFLLLYCPRWLFLFPGLTMIIAGLVSGIWLIPGPKSFAGIVFDIHTLLYSSLSIMLGFQAVFFAMLTKVFAVGEKLLPVDTRVNKLCKIFTLEVGLCLGFLLFILGIAGNMYALTSWGMHSFGPLNPSETLRVVIPSVTCTSIGLEIILSSFFLSILGLKRN
jgi:glycosyltransferase involved in cell wall biosynthesis